jgi:predicted ATP-grasp superfamily ATP-dependent carboligase
MLSVALFLAWSQIFLSTGLCILDFMLKIPLSVAKWVLSSIYGARGGSRTVIVTGSSIETLQVARNFYQCGARVVVLEHDDKFGLVRFSTAVDKFYKVPVPQKSPQEYVRELCRIAERENAAYFVPTATSNPAHFDALAKPHLEQLGVLCVCPGVKETFLLDDPFALLQMCSDAGLATPINYRVCSPEQLTSLYEEGTCVAPDTFF